MSETSSQPPSDQLLEVDEAGTVRVPTFDLPISAALSDEARAGQVALLGRSPMDLPNFDGVDSEAEFASTVNAYRAKLDETVAKPLAEATKARFPVLIEEDEIAGVRVERFRPTSETSADRVLLNLHGGAFMSGAKYIARAESIPVAHLSKIPVISIDYRMAHEYRFPSGHEDVAAVYANLLQRYEPSQIGIYGGSAGGRLTAQVVAHLIQHDIPVPGAIGIFGSGGGGPGGDSKYFSAIGMAKLPPEPDRDPIEKILFGPFGYMSEVGRNNPVAEPVTAGEEVLSKYPPTLLITGTRAFDLSDAISFHRALVRTGVDASLHVFDGLGHCFYYNAWIPESLDAYDTIVRFFREHLDVRPAY